MGFEGGFSVHKKSINANIHPDWVDSHLSHEFVRLPRTNFDIVFANDILREAKAAWVPYFKREGIFFNNSIVDLVKKQMQGDFVFPEADLVIGGFPCQDFSVSGKRKGFQSHKTHLGTHSNKEPSIENRGQLYMWMRKVIEITKPKMFIAENVKGLVSLEDVKRVIQEDFRNINNGYHVYDAKVLNAAEYGVPQSRERVIFIGVNKDALDPESLMNIQNFQLYPKKTHTKKENLAKGLQPFVTLQDVLGNLQEPDISKDLEQTCFSKAKWYGSHCQGNKEVDLSSVGPTIRAEHHGNIEFRRLSLEHGGKYVEELNKGAKERRLTIRECARIQTFPDDYQFIRPASILGKAYALSTTNAYKIIGNAVPPFLGFHIAWSVQEAWHHLFGEEHDYLEEQHQSAGNF